MVEVLIVLIAGIVIGSVLYLPAMIAASKKRYIMTACMFGAMVLGLHAYGYDKILSAAIVVVVWIVSFITANLVESHNKRD